MFRLLNHSGDSVVHRIIANNISIHERTKRSINSKTNHMKLKIQFSTSYQAFEINFHKEQESRALNTKPHPFQKKKQKSHSFTQFFQRYWTFRKGSFYHHPMAYFCVQLRAVVSYLVRSDLYMWAISGTSGSSGLGSVSREQIESRT